VIHVLVSTYLQGPDVVEQTRPAHLKFLEAEIEAGRLLLAGRQEDESGGVLITSEMTAEEAEALVDHDPHVQVGVARYERRTFQRRIPRSRALG
jgi:uncharacterized protein